MVDTRSCDYCGSAIEPGTGTMFVRVDGEVIHYCSSKCENNADLGRASRDLEWTAEGQRIGASQAGTPDEAEQVAAEPPSEDESMVDEMDTVEAESEAEAVAAAAGDAGSRSGEPAAATDDRVDDDATADTDELDEIEGRRAGGSDPDVEEDQDTADVDESEAEATVGEETVRDTDDEDDQ